MDLMSRGAAKRSTILICCALTSERMTFSSPCRCASESNCFPEDIQTPRLK